MHGLSSCIQASQHGNADATERLGALSQPAPLALSRQEHDNLTETTLVRKRTQAKQRSDARGPAGGPRQGGRPNGQQVVANIRKNSLAYRPGPGYPPPMPAPADNYATPRLPAAQIPPPLGGPGPNMAGGSRPPIQPGPGPSGGYTPPLRQQPLPGPQPPQGNNNPGPLPGGYPSPRMPPQQPYAQLARPPSQPSLGGGGAGQPGQPGRRPMRVGSGSTPPSQQASVRTPSPTALSDPPVARPPPAKGPSTFQEMGYQSSKLEEKDCVIM